MITNKDQAYIFDHVPHYQDYEWDYRGKKNLIKIGSMYVILYTLPTLDENTVLRVIRYASRPPYIYPESGVRL